MPADSTHALYDQWLPVWKMMRDLTAGELQVKNATTEYLPRLSGQDEYDYADYLSGARLFPATARTVQGLLGSVFRVAPVTQVPEKMEPWLADIDLGGTPLNMLLQHDLGDKLVTGRFGIRVDVREDSPRPYLATYTTEHIINWRYGVVRGMKMLTMVVLREIESSYENDEFEAEEEEVLHVLDLPDGYCRFRIFRYNRQTRKWAPELMPAPARGDEPLDVIPFFLDGVTSITPDCEKPPLLDVATVNLGHYRTSADYYDAIRFTSKPQPYVVGVGKMAKEDQARLRIGSRYAWTLPTGASAGYLETSGNGIPSIREALQDDEARMARLGAAVIEEPKAGVESAETSRINQYGKMSLLSSLVTTTSQTITKALQLLAYWGRMTAVWEDPDIRCTLNKEFVASTLEPAALESLVRSWQARGISRETLIYNVQRGGLLPPEVTVEREMSLIDVGDGLPNVEDDTLDETGEPPIEEEAA